MKALLACILTALIAGTALAGSFSDTRIHHTTTWSADGCQRPAQPPMPGITDKEGYATAVKVYNAYVEMVNDYNRCVNEEAQRDAKTVIESINRGNSESQRSMLEELRKMRLHLGAKHPDNSPL